MFFSALYYNASCLSKSRQRTEKARWIPIRRADVRVQAMYKTRFNALLAVLLINVGASLAVNAGTVTDWNTIATDNTTAFQNPATQTHTLAIVHIAIHDALNAIRPRYNAYVYQGSAPEASVDAAVATAARSTLVPLVPEATDAIEAAYTQVLASIPEGSGKAAGVEIGQAAAAAILSLRQTDDLVAVTTRPYIPGDPAPGVYQATPPLNFVILAGWGGLTPFSRTDIERFRSEPPYSINSLNYAWDYHEVKTLGSLKSERRNDRQTDTAKFWYDVSTKEWHHAAQSGLAEVAADEWRAARLLALLSIAMADGAIASMETKFVYNFWRPITAIRAGDEDGNPFTRGNRDWEPLCITPPFPEYNSTHAVTAAAAATTLASEFGDRHRFAVESPLGQIRTFKRFSTAAYEEAVSRIYCGIHFRHAMNAGLAQGAKIARYTRAHFFLSRNTNSGSPDISSEHDGEYQTE